MSALYPEETKKLNVVAHLEEMRRRILLCLGVLVLTSICAFWQGSVTMSFVVRPIKGLVDDLIFIAPTEAFTAYLTVALLCGFILSFPFILYHVWAFLAPAFPAKVRGRVVLWLLMALLLFVSGIVFSYLVALPTALNFLIGFSEGIATPSITLGRYISFFGALILVGGTVFEVPVVIGLLADTGLVTASTLRAKRHYAVLLIMICAAVITPTHDIFNMLIFSLPMMVLYEAGILIASLVGRGKSAA
jgi:sec-independent protein translocase protein TatC